MKPGWHWIQKPGSDNLTYLGLILVFTLVLGLFALSGLAILYLGPWAIAGLLFLGWLSDRGRR